ncbi:esterase [Draconibacterium mangrovi]|uniref:esterase n=1 Tax=Draconibacterium mangrovi TaxID=2697469 RepID=UPI0013D04DC6|nr:esterase [Draconibacterium mangrovi]
MKKLTFLFVLFLATLAIDTIAQQNLFGGQDIESAIVNQDNTVTFRFIAPNAKEVSVAGDFVSKVEDNPIGGMVGTGLAPMTKDQDGTWTLTTEPLASELYSYLFLVDGVATTDPNNPFVFRDFATFTNVFVVGNGQADLYKVNDIPHGSISHDWYESKGMGKDRRVNIYTPPGYKKSKEKYPVLYLLHGYGGDEDEWVNFGRTAQIIDNLIAQGKAKPMMVVMPNGHIDMEASPGESSIGFVKPKHSTDYPASDGTFEGNFDEIIDFVENNYRAVPDKAHRAIAGLSMGGFHAIHISAIHKNTFDYVGVFSSGHNVILNDGKGVFANFDASLTKQKENGLQLYWVGIGVDDFLYKQNKEFRALLDKTEMEYTYVETGGGHIWKNWRIYLGDFAPLLFKN